MENNDLAIFSDIHGNLQALEAVLEDINEKGISKLVCLGDIVGYGAQPAECLERVRKLGCKVVMGNHDALCADGGVLEGLSERTRPGVLWAREQLDADQKAWLAALPYSLETEGCEMVHASLWQPELWRYVLTTDEAALHFKKQKKQVCFIGHTHFPQAWEEGAERALDPISMEDIREGKRYIVNVGSVGQPRDRDNRACYGIYSRVRRVITFRRIAYDLAGAQDAIIAARLPAPYAQRLEQGR
jgi:diadenosine tetraphosphatase ApaH/serine/threonine PP2A family protein phosphatase